ncbi:cobalamin-binding protein [Pseudoalteromonas sp. T1lg65]|uniref:cobalamin-binding protein n=1 Tax=Pseudoalteromonas sp. T1lg65 TaxID=2077101 RepID=UPI003F794468
MLRTLFLLLLLNVSAPTFSTENPAKRIIALAPHIVENLFAIGAGEQIVGTVAYADYPEAAKTIQRIGGHHGIQLEQVLALQPDLVIAWASGSKKEDIEKLQQLGIKVIYSDAKRIDKIADELRQFGQLTGKVAEAEQLAVEFTSKLEKLRTHYQGAKKITVFYQLWPSPLMSVGGNSWLQQVLEVCSVNNVFADSTTDYPQLSIENVLSKKPQVMILPQEKTDQEIANIDWQNWPEIPAVKHQQFISVDADLLHRFSYRMLEGTSDLCAKLANSRAYYKGEHDNVE